MATSPASWIRNEWYGSVWKKLKVTAAATAVVIAAARLIKAATTTMIASDTPTIVDPTSPRTVDVAAPTATATAGPATTATRANRVVLTKSVVPPRARHSANFTRPSRQSSGCSHVLCGQVAGEVDKIGTVGAKAE